MYVLMSLHWIKLNQILSHPSKYFPVLFCRVQVTRKGFFSTPDISTKENWNFLSLKSQSSMTNTVWKHYWLLLFRCSIRYVVALLKGRRQLEEISRYMLESKLNPVPQNMTWLLSYVGDEKFRVYLPITTSKALKELSFYGAFSTLHNSPLLKKTKNISRLGSEPNWKL